VDVALCGGSEFAGDEYGAVFKGFDAARTLAQASDNIEASNRPFDKDRSGFLFSEGGAATLVVEDLESAKARGAKIIAEISGYGESFDAYNMMRPAESGEQASRALQQAIDDANLTTTDIGYINTHGTGTHTNDEIEAKMLEKMFPSRPLINSTKALIGHTIGASGALEAVITAKSLQNDITHDCKNLENPIADLNFCSGQQKLDAKHAISHSFAFGGHNHALVISKYV
jgi:3-oxoacyl-[acyl-carrier-protein] synthase II